MIGAEAEAQSPVPSPEWLSWNRYHQQVAQAMGAPEPTLVHIPTDLMFDILPAEAEWCRENFQYNNIFDNRAAEEDLDFRYTIALIEGVRRIVAWLDERGRITDADEPAFYERLFDSWRQVGAEMASKV